MPNKPAYTIADQIQLLKSRGMLFRDEHSAAELLKSISYYRLKGYWWDMQTDYTLHIFEPNTYFEDIVDRYDFDRNLRLLLFDAIANEMGLNLHNELSSWLESIAYVRNIIAHHSRLWSKNMVKKPVEQLNNPIGQWFTRPLSQVQTKKPFLIISSMLYLCNVVAPSHQIKTKILALINSNPQIPVYKLGFLNNWQNEPLWQ